MARITFLETEHDEQQWLARELAEHELHFAYSAEDDLRAPEILSVFLNTPIDAAFLDRHPAVRLIATRSTTAEHIDLPECRRRNIAIANVPQYGDHTVAEHTFALMLGLTRRLREAMESSRRDYFSYENVRGTELRGKTLGVVGGGHIGQAVIEMARAFKLRTLVFDPAPQSEVAARLGFEYVAFAELLAQSDIITLHAALTPDTYHLFDAEAFAKCRPGVLIINTARGRLIDTNALCDALDSGQVGGAGLDVLEDERVMREATSHLIGSQIIERLHASFPPRELRSRDSARVQELEALMQNHRLLARPNVLFTPHIAFNSIEAIERILQTTVENIRCFLAGKPQNLVAA